MIRPNFGITDCPFVTSGKTPANCSVGGTTTLTLSGGATPYNFAWSNGADSSSIKNLVGGVYSVTITTGSCTLIDSLTIADQTYSLSLGGTTTNASNAISADGAIVLNISGGVPPYVTSPAGLTNLSAGEYIVTVTDSNLCTATDTFTVSFTNGIERSNAINTVHIFPNPTKDKLMLASNQTIQTATLYNLLGEQIIQQTIATKNAVININALAKGIYLLKMKGNDFEKIERVVKE